MAGVKRRVMKGLAAGAAALLVLGIAAPFVHADRYRGPIQSSLSTALGRKVSIDGHVSFSLFTGPALSVDNVQIAEADQSSEPFAYVDQVRAVPRLFSLWTGHLEFASLTLDGAHVNLVRYGEGTTPSWNFEPLLSPGLLAAFPAIHMRDSRINFVLEGRKSPFYLLGADLDVTPRSADGSNWSVRFAGAPARSDRPAHGFGVIGAGGTWRRAGGDNGLLALDLTLERSEMSDILALVYGRDAGIHGIVSAQAHVAGPMRALGIEGEARVSELHGWDQSPPSSGVFPFRVSGVLNTPAQHLDLFAQPRARQGPSQWMLHVSADSYLERPFFKMDFRSDGLPIAPLPGLLHNFGANLPDGLQLTGVVTGSVAFDSRAGWTGNATIPETTLDVGGGAPLKLEECAFAISGSEVTAGPVEVTSGVDPVAEASARYSISDGAFQVSLVSRDAPLSTLLQRFPAASIPFLSDIHSGVWTGQLTYAQPAGKPGAWQGEGDLTAATAALPALSQPIDIAHATLRIDGPDIQLDHLVMSVAGIDITGDYKYTHDAPAPHQFHFALPRAELAVIETLLHPLLNHGGSLLDRALGRSSLPKWLADTRAAGSIEVASLDTAGPSLSRIRAGIVWLGERIGVNSLVLHNGEATISGALNLDLRNPKPHYSGSGLWTNLPWKDGYLSGTVAQFETSGSGIETLTNLKARGTVTGKDMDVAPLGAIDRMTGSYIVSFSGAALRLRFPELRLEGDGGEVWTGSGGSQGTDGEVTLRPSGGRQITLAGSITDASKDWVELVNR